LERVNRYAVKDFDKPAEWIECKVMKILGYFHFPKIDSADELTSP